MGKAKTADEVRRFPVEYRKQANRTMTGKAAPYGGVHDIGAFTETLSVSCFSKSIREAAANLPLLMHHDHESVPVAKATEWEERDDGLYGHWTFDSRSDATEAARLADEGFLTGLSVGFQTIRSHRDDSGEKPHIVRTEARLLETSMVSIPAYDEARVIAVRSKDWLEITDEPLEPKLTPRLDRAMQILERLRAVS